MFVVQLPLDTATDLVGLLLAAWGVYLARIAAFPKKPSGLPESHFGEGLSKKILLVVDEKVREALGRLGAAREMSGLSKKNLLGDIAYSA